jgi:predicted DNA-binding transcriptional regulator YafY
MATKKEQLKTINQMIAEAEVKDLRKIERAVNKNATVVFEYRKQGEEPETRVVQLENLLVSESGDRYVNGHDLIRNEARSFRLDRVKAGSVRSVR